MGQPDWAKLWAMEPSLRPDGLDVCRGMVYHQDADNLRGASIADLCLAAAVRWLAEQGCWLRNVGGLWSVWDRDRYGIQVVRGTKHHHTADAALYAACEAVLNARVPH
jgi:hypothetical protein